MYLSVQKVKRFILALVDALLIAMKSSPKNTPEMATDADKIIMILLCIFLPPLAVFWKTKDVNIHLVISIVLCLLFWLPGILHAFWYCFFQ